MYWNNRTHPRASKPAKECARFFYATETPMNPQQARQTNRKAAHSPLWLGLLCVLFNLSVLLLGSVQPEAPQSASLAPQCSLKAPQKVSKRLTFSASFQPSIEANQPSNSVSHQNLRLAANHTTHWKKPEKHPVFDSKRLNAPHFKKRPARPVRRGSPDPAETSDRRSPLLFAFPSPHSLFPSPIS